MLGYEFYRGVNGVQKIRYINDVHTRPLVPQYMRGVWQEINEEQQNC